MLFKLRKAHFKSLARLGHMYDSIIIHITRILVDLAIANRKLKKKKKKDLKLEP
jgi:hypothetical protein